MIILSEKDNKVVGCFLDGTTVTNLPDVAELPQAENKIGKDAVLKIDPTTKALSYDYVDRGLTEAEKLQQMQVQIESLQSATASALGV